MGKFERESNEDKSEKLEDLDFEEDEDPICPNCGQATEGETTCPYCGAVLADDDDEFEGFTDDEI